MKKCVRCQTEMKQTQLICPNCKKYQHPIIGIFGVLIIILSITAWFNSLQELTNSSSLSNDDEKCYISLKEFNEIQTGMSYDEIKNIVGCEGTINSQTEYMEIKMTIYSWYGKDGISNANVTIQNDKLINKTQIGLK